MTHAITAFHSDAGHTLLAISDDVTTRIWDLASSASVG
jgi:WD40 repeat protein